MKQFNIKTIVKYLGMRSPKYECEVEQRQKITISTCELQELFQFFETPIAGSLNLKITSPQFPRGY